MEGGWDIVQNGQRFLNRQNGLTHSLASRVRVVFPVTNPLWD